MDQLKFQIELSAFDEKITLAELEEAKAAERVKEIKYQKARFQLDWFKMIAKAQEQQAKTVISSEKK
jgi:hypothetical protein